MSIGNSGKLKAMDKRLGVIPCDNTREKVKSLLSTYTVVVLEKQVGITYRTLKKIENGQRVSDSVLAKLNKKITQKKL